MFCKKCSYRTNNNAKAVDVECALKFCIAAWEEEKERQRIRNQLLEERKRLRADEKEQRKQEEMERRKKLYKGRSCYEEKLLERRNSIFLCLNIGVHREGTGFLVTSLKC